MTRQMDEARASEIIAALAQPTRLAVFRRLVNVPPDDIAARDIARMWPRNTVSVHLAVLARAGLIAARREGRMMRYAADLTGFRAAVAFLMRDCCNGRTEICAPLIAELTCCGELNQPEKVHG